MNERRQYQRKKIPDNKFVKRGGKYQSTISWQGARPRPTFDTKDDLDRWYAAQYLRMSQGLPLEVPDTHQPRNTDGRARTVEDLYTHTKNAHWLVSGPTGGPVKSWDKSRSLLPRQSKRWARKPA